MLRLPRTSLPTERAVKSISDICAKGTAYGLAARICQATMLVVGIRVTFSELKAFAHAIMSSDKII